MWLISKVFFDPMASIKDNNCDSYDDDDDDDDDGGDGDGDSQEDDDDDDVVDVERS